MRRSTLGWAALAVAGLLIAAGAAYAASRIATQPIGLSSEPISAGRQLAPRAGATPRPARTRTPVKHKRRPRRTPAATATRVPTAVPTTVPTAAPTAAPTIDDHGGGGGGSSGGKGKGGGSDD